MSEVKQAKDALVLSLFELSKAAQDAAAATAHLYKVSNNPAEEHVATLGLLSQAIHTLVSSIDAKPVKRALAPADGAAAATDAAAPPKKKKKVVRDPNAPKKPLTMYFAYSFDVRDAIREDRKAKGLPPLSAIDMNAHVKDKWSNLSPEEKAKWQQKYQEDLKVYNVKKEEYKLKLAGDAAAAAAAPESHESVVDAAAIAPVLAAVESSDDSDSDSEEEKRRKEQEEREREERKKRKKDEKKKKKKKDL